MRADSPERPFALEHSETMAATCWGIAVGNGMRADG